MIVTQLQMRTDNNLVLELRLGHKEKDMLCVEESPTSHLSSTSRPLRRKQPESQTEGRRCFKAHNFPGSEV